MEHMIVMKYNNCASSDPCALCGERTDPRTGPELFLDGTWSLVCDVCAEAHAPELLRLRGILSNIESAVDSCEAPNCRSSAAALRVLERLSGRDYMTLKKAVLREPRGCDPDRLPLLRHEVEAEHVPF